MQSYYFEEFNEGEVFKTRARTITEADVIAFTGLSWDTNPLHTDAEYASKTIFGERIAHGALIFAIHTGLSAALGHLSTTVIAFLGMTWNFLEPVKIGDTVLVEQVVKEKKEVKKKDRGIVIFDTRVVNQKGAVVQQGDKTVMVKRKAD